MRTLSIDIESYSDVDLLSCGVYRYVESPAFEILLFAYSFDYEEPTVIDLTDFESIPREVLEALWYPSVTKTAYNASFERICLAKHFGKPIPTQEWECTQVLAASCGLPLGLANVSKALRLGEDKAKMKEGKDLINYFCKPCKPTKANGMRTRNLPHHAPEKWELFKKYNAQDVVAENEIRKICLSYRPDATEHKIWCLDQKINDTGVNIDMKLVDSAIAFDERAKKNLLQEAIEISHLDNPTSVAQIKGWLESCEGLTVESLNKKSMPDVLAQIQSDEAKRFLELRNELSKTSVKKYEAMKRCACDDNRARGLFQFAGTRTLRWAGRLIQLQNLPQNHIEPLREAREMVRAELYNEFEAIYENVSSTLSELIRTAIIPSPYHKFLVCDFSAIEARVIAWYAKEEWVLEEFRGDGLIYEATASQMFKVDKHTIKKGGVHSDLRPKGKVAQLACIAKGQLVVTNQGLIPIEQVTLDHLVWDGSDYVSHDGVIYKGKKEVITYEGLTATEDHLVFIEGADEPIPFGEAAKSGAHLVQPRGYWSDFWKREDNKSTKEMEPKLESLLRRDRMYRLWEKRMDSIRQSPKWQIQRMPKLFSASKDLSQVVIQKIICGKAKMHKSEKSRVSQLWCKGNNLRLQKCRGCLCVCCTELRNTTKRYGARPNRQQWKLCCWKPTMVNKTRKYSKQTMQPHKLLESKRMAILKKCCCSKNQGRHDERSYFTGCFGGSKEQKKELETNRREVEVYDILNAGPNHRFTVSGALVHNCGYGGGVGALKAFGADKMGMTEAEMKNTVDLWREANPNIVEWWWSVDRAAKRCVKNKCDAYDEIGGLTFSLDTENDIMYVTLPSGRKMCYLRPRLAKGKFDQTCIIYEGMNQTTRKLESVETYGPKLVENIVQATARDCLRDAMLNLDNAGYKIVMHVHDEVVCEEPIGGRSYADMEKIMAITPSWAEGLPLRGDGEELDFYKK